MTDMILNTRTDTSILREPQYDFLHTDQQLGNKICLLGYGGSYAYGTNIEGSDIDLRGVAYNTADEILLGKDFEQVVNTETDTTVYSFKKIISLLINCNPNTIELLGLRPQDYLVMDETGKELVRNAHMFLSKRCIYTFGGYANAQLRRLQHRAMRSLEQEQREKHMKKSIDHASITFMEQVAKAPDDAFRLYINKSDKEDYDSEMFVDLHLDHYPLRDLKVLYEDVSAIIRDYDKIGKRNHNAYTHAKIAKHSMHLVRLYLMAIDILKYEEIRTYRQDEHDLLMEIRNGKYLDETGQPVPEFFKLVDELEAKMDEAAADTNLPDLPDMEAIEKFVCDVNRKIVLWNMM